MAQQQKARKPPQDPYAQRSKTLTSSVQRLRGWVGSDPSRAPELADALLELTTHRLLGHGYAAAAPDAQEGVRRAAQLLTANGPIGPYTSVSDAVRYVDAVVNLATVQAGLGLPDTAGRTIESLQDMRERLRELRLDQQLKPQTAIWALSCSARAAMASGDVGSANAYADAVLARLAESGLRDDPDAAYVAIDADRLASDCRWAAGRAEEALSHLHLAKDRYEEVVAGRLQEPARLSPVLVERLAEPLFGLYRDMADRLAGSGELDLGLVTRRALVETLHGLAGPLGDPARIHLAAALADLADDLLAADRVDEAEAAADEAAAMVLDWSGAGSVRLLVAATRARALTRLDRSGEAVAMLRRVLTAGAGESPSLAHAVGLLALADALRAEDDLDAAGSSERAFDDLKRDLLGPLVDPMLARSAVQDLARGVVSRGAQPVTWEPLDPAVSYAATTASIAGSDRVDEVNLIAERQRETDAWLEAERAEAHRLEVERLEQARIEAERREAERREAERALAEKRAADRAEAEQAARLEAERRAAAEEEERLERKRRREERLQAHRLDVERQEAERREAQRLEQERRAAERRAADPAEAERLELERLSAELAELERATERDRAERLEAEQSAAEQAATERAEQVAAEKLAVEREAERIEAEREAGLRAERELEAQRLVAEQAEAERIEAERVEAERAEAERIEAAGHESERIAAERRAAEQAEAERSEAARIEAGRAERERVESEHAEAERIEAERFAAERAEAERAEAERIESERLAVERAEVERAEAERIEAERLAVERAQAERIEAERLAVEHAEAERIEAERSAAERAEAEQAEAERIEAERIEAERAEAERREAARFEAERVEAERVEAEQAEAERAERAEADRRAAEQGQSDGDDTAPDALSIAQQDWRFAKAAGDRRSARVAIERVVELLRPRADADLVEYGPQLQDALEELSSARLRSGDIWGSRAPAKEAKTLGKALGR